MLKYILLGIGIFVAGGAVALLFNYKVTSYIERTKLESYNAGFKDGYRKGSDSGFEEGMKFASSLRNMGGNSATELYISELEERVNV